MNIADQTYATLYELLTNTLQPAFILIMINWRSTLILVITLALVWIGYRNMLSKSGEILGLIKQLAVVAIFLLFVLNPYEVYTTLKFVLLDIPLEAGALTLDGITGVLGIGGSNIDVVPDADGKTAFGILWDLGTMIADQLWEEGGFGNIGALFLGALVYGISIVLLILQIIVMATALTLVMVAILSAPLFMWMFLFPMTKKMFESWLGLGLGAGFALYILMVMMGVIFAFFARAFSDSFGVDIQTLTPDGIEPDAFEKMKHIASLVLFMGIGIKMIPKVEVWASSLAGVSVQGISEGINYMGGQIAGAMGLNKTTASLASKGAKGAGTAALGGSVAAGTAMAGVVGDQVRKIRDSAFAEKLRRTSDDTGTEQIGSNGSETGDKSSRSIKDNANQGDSTFSTESGSNNDTTSISTRDQGGSKALNYNDGSQGANEQGQNVQSSQAEANSDTARSETFTPQKSEIEGADLRKKAQMDSVEKTEKVEVVQEGNLRRDELIERQNQQVQSDHNEIKSNQPESNVGSNNASTNSSVQSGAKNTEKNIEKEAVETKSHGGFSSQSNRDELIDRSSGSHQTSPQSSNNASSGQSKDKPVEKSGKRTLSEQEKDSAMSKTREIKRKEKKLVDKE